MAGKKMKPIHPGEILEMEFLKPLGISQYRLAKSIHVPADRIGKIIAHKRGITAVTAMRLGRFFGTSAEMWMNLQARYDLETAEDEHGKEIAKEVSVMRTDVAA